MATYAAVIPTNGSANGRMVKIVATSSPGTSLHTAHATALDEVYIWAMNTDTVARKLTIEMGGTTSPDDDIEVTIAAESGFILVVPGIRLTGGIIIKGFAAATNVIVCAVNINRITA
jgi:hypothetical protein